MGNIITQSNKIAIRESDYKPGVMYQTQTLGIEFKHHHKDLPTHCPKCGAQNTAIYFDIKTLQGKSITVHCHQCGIPYMIEIPVEDSNADR